MVTLLVEHDWLQSEYLVQPAPGNYRLTPVFALCSIAASSLGDVTILLKDSMEFHTLGLTGISPRMIEQFVIM